MEGLFNMSLDKECTNPTKHCQHWMLMAYNGLHPYGSKIATVIVARMAAIAGITSLGWLNIQSRIQ